MTNLLGMPPPAPPADVPPLPPRAGDPNAKEPTMRQKMLDHRVRQDCVQCHRLMDPIGFALENFDGIGLWRTADEGTPVDPKAQTFDNTQIDGPQQLRDWLTTKYAEKLLTYGLGRGVEYRDMPTVRAIARETVKNNGRFSSIVMGVVKSKPFQMNTKVDATTSTASTRTGTESRGVN